MKRTVKSKKIIPVLLLMLISIAFWKCSHSSSNNSEEKILNSEAILSPSGNDSDLEIAVESPPFSEGIYPCNDCHAYITPNPQRRKLVDMHEEISNIFDHDSENRWCLDCHDMNNRDSLKLASGKLLSFKESYKLCGQCHGEKLRDWKVGVHGKRTGYWNGKKEYLLCVHCHSPHSPRFKPLTPEPPPVRQEDIAIYEPKNQNDEKE